MNKFDFAVVLIYCFAVLSFAETAPGEIPAKGEKPKCMGVEIKITEEMMSPAKSCWNNTKIPEGKDKEKGIDYCRVVCQFQALGLLDSAGKIVEAKVAPYANSVFHEAAADKITKAVTTCSQEKGGSIAITKEDCSSIKDVFDCVRDEIMKICAEEKTT